MIDFKYLDANLNELNSSFSSAFPFEHVVIDNFCFPEKLRSACDAIRSSQNISKNKSKDYIFAKNKFEKANFDSIHLGFKKLKEELLSDRFSDWVSKLTNEDIFIDPDFHGGGLHQGGKGSFLDMHADFNYHPEKLNWFRNINILIYLNENWMQSYGGSLKLRDGREKNSETITIEPIFNRAVIMFTRGHTLHGYDPISFPDNTFRTSIAAYGYTLKKNKGSLRTTTWFPERGGKLKSFLGKHTPKLVALKTRLFGSGTSRNK